MTKNQLSRKNARTRHCTIFFPLKLASTSRRVEHLQQCYYKLWPKQKYVFNVCGFFSSLKLCKQKFTLTRVLTEVSSLRMKWNKPKRLINAKPFFMVVVSVRLICFICKNITNVLVKWHTFLSWCIGHWQVESFEM